MKTKKKSTKKSSLPFSDMTLTITVTDDKTGAVLAKYPQRHAYLISTYEKGDLLNSGTQAFGPSGFPTVLMRMLGLSANKYANEVFGAADPEKHNMIPKDRSGKLIKSKKR